MTHEIFGQAPGSRVSWASDLMYFSGQQDSPTLDAIGHIGRDLKLHGGVDVRAGDALLIRTGWGRYFGKEDARYLGERSPGPGQDAARWIIDRSA